MNLNEFTFMVRDCICDYLTPYDVEDVYEREIIKNNGVRYTGIVIALKGRDASPTIYMDYYYGLYKRGKSIEEIMELIYKNYKISLDRLELTEKEAGNLDNYEDMLFIKVINYEKNKAGLEDCPFIPFLDMAITFRYLVHKDDKDISSAIVKNSLMDIWGLDTHKIFKLAYENTKKLFPPIIKKLSDLLRMNAPTGVYIPDNDMYILTNESGINGAAYMIYKDILDDFCRNKRISLYLSFYLTLYLNIHKKSFLCVSRTIIIF